MALRTGLPMALKRHIQSNSNVGQLIKLQKADNSLTEHCPIYVTREIKNRIWTYRITGGVRKGQIDYGNFKGRVWLTGELHLYPYLDQEGRGLDVAAEVLQFIYRRLHSNNLRFIRIYSKETISYEDFEVIARTAQVFDLNVHMVWDNGIPANLEDLLTSLPAVRELQIRYQPEFGEIAEVLLRWNNIANLEFLCIFDVPATTDFILLQLFILGFTGEHQAYFFKSDIDDDYREKLDHLVDRVLSVPGLTCRIVYDGQDEQKGAQMLERFD